MRHYNLNGSSPESIRDEAVRALEALQKAQELFAPLIPHGRDYQGHPDPDALATDRAEHADHYRMLREASNYLTETIIHAMDFGKS